MNDLTGYINHSGGAIGSDLWWEIIGSRYGVLTHAYGFNGHKTNSKSEVRLTSIQLAAASKYVSLANSAFASHGEKYKRRFPTPNPYTNHLLERNWYQVLYSDAVYAIGILDFKVGIVAGGTGWAVQMALNTPKPVFVFAYQENNWYSFNYERSRFQKTDVPTLTKNFAGIGTRGIKHGNAYLYPKNAKIAIEKVYEKTLHTL